MGNTTTLEEACINLDQFKQFFEKKDVQLWLKAMDYDASDASLLFHLIDENGDGLLTVDELITGMASLKGGARNIDVKLLLRQSLLGLMKNTSMDSSGRKLTSAESLGLLEGLQTSEALHAV